MLSVVIYTVVSMHKFNEYRDSRILTSYTIHVALNVTYR